MGCRHAAGDKNNQNSRQEARKGKKGSGLMDAWRGQSWCPDKGSVPGPTWPGGESICKGSFLQSLREVMSGYHDMLRQKPFSLFMLLVSSSLMI
jgi:hypothetical protein